eukprot:Hpha_TRINITY_DN16665_c0_g15::TRINITY_DN16665_c0_g15_i1::g.182242::m.182242
MGRGSDAERVLWVGHLTEGSPQGSKDIVAQEFVRDLWRQLVAVAKHALQSCMQDTNKKSMGQRAVAGVKVDRSRVMEQIIEASKALNLTTAGYGEVCRAIRVFCDAKLKCSDYNGKEYYYAVLRFPESSLRELFLLHTPNWPKPWVTVLPASGEGSEEGDEPSPMTCRRESESRAPPVIHEVMRRREEAPAGWWRALEALVGIVCAQYKDLDEREREVCRSFHVNREPSVPISKYLERIYLYSGQNAFSRIIVGIIYLERLITGGEEEGVVRMQHVINSSTALAQSAGGAPPRDLRPQLPAAPIESCAADDTALRACLLAINSGHRAVQYKGEGHWLFREWGDLEGEWDLAGCDAASRARKLFRHVSDIIHDRIGEIHQGKGGPHDEPIGLRRPDGDESEGEEEEGEGEGAEERMLRCAVVPEEGRVRVTELTIHKMILTAALLATKQHDDTLRSNPCYAAVGGFPLNQLQTMEADMLRILQYDLWVEPEFYKQFQSELRRFCSVYVEKELRPLARREWAFLFQRPRGDMESNVSRYVDMCVNRLLTPAEVVEVAGVLERYRHQCREELRELRRQAMQNTHSVTLLREQHRERRRVIDKRFGTGFVPADDEDFSASEEEAARICDFAESLPTAIELAWAQVLRAALPGSNCAAGLRGVAKACTKLCINPAQLPAMTKSSFEAALGSSEFVCYRDQVCATVEKMWSANPQQPLSSHSAAPHLEVEGLCAPPRQAKVRSKPPPVDVQLGGQRKVCLAQMHFSDPRSFQAVCREYIVANGSQLPEETLRSPLAASFRQGNMSPRHCASRRHLFSSGHRAGALSPSPYSGASPSPRQVQQPHAMASHCLLSPGGMSPTQGAGEGSPFQRTACQSHYRIWTRLSTNVALNGSELVSPLADKLG